MEPGATKKSRSFLHWGVAGAILLAAHAAGARNDDHPRGDLTAASAQAPNCLTEDEQELGRLINEYRAENGLSPVPLSRSLTQVAKVHVLDLNENNPLVRSDASGKPCSLHSWSDAGPWNAVCYTRDNARAQDMWSKPRELTEGAYEGHGFENAYWTSRPVTPRMAFEAWKRSPGHNALMLQEGAWRKEPWNAMGFALSDHYAVVWFGDADDPSGEAEVCDGSAQKALSAASLGSALETDELVASSAPGR